MCAADPVSRAKSAMKAGDFASALAAFRTIPVSGLEPLAAVRLLVNMSVCALQLGDEDESRDFQRRGFETLMTSPLASHPTPDISRLALLLAIGARDLGATRKFMAAIFPSTRDILRDLRIAPAMHALRWCRNNGVKASPLGGPDPNAPGAAWQAVVADAEVLAGWDFVVAPSGEVLEGANHFPINTAVAALPHVFNPVLNLVAHIWPQDVVGLSEDVLCLITSEGHHYGHWLAEFLPRLEAWDGRRKIAISASLPAKHRELLSCFGVRTADLVECEMGRRYKFRSLHVVFAGKPSSPHRSGIEFLYRALGPKRRSPPTRRLFLVREAGTRLPANMLEVDGLLAEFNFDKVNPARLTYGAQAALFADTRVIIGAFGTELYCMFNMQPGAAVIELSFDEGLLTTYGPIAAFLGMHHAAVSCSRAGARGSVRHNIDGDIVVDCSALRKELQALLQ